MSPTARAVEMEGGWICGACEVPSNVNLSLPFSGRPGRISGHNMAATSAQDHIFTEYNPHFLPTRLNSLATTNYLHGLQYQGAIGALTN